jgi:hypothetical protein
MNKHWHRSVEDGVCSMVPTRQKHQKQAVPSIIRPPKKLDAGYDAMAGSHVSVEQMDIISRTRREQAA